MKISLRVQILVLFTLLFTIVFAIAFFWFYQYSTKRAMERIREDMVDTLKGTIAGINGDEFESLAKDIPPIENDVPAWDERYKIHQHWLEQVYEIEPRSNPYTYVPANDSDDPRRPILFVGDILRTTRPDIGTGFLESYTPMRLFMNRGYNEIVVDMEPYTDDWGSWVSAYGPIKNSDGESVGAVGIDFSIDYVNQVQQGITQSIVIAFIITYGVLLSLVFIIAHFLTRPIANLTNVALSIGEGNYNQEFKDQRILGVKNEINTLVEVLSAMVEKVLEREAQYRAVVSTQSELICRWKMDGTFSFVNEAFCKFIGQEEEALIGRHFSPPIYHEDLEIYNNIIKEVTNLTPDNPSKTVTVRMLTTYGDIRWLHWHIQGVFDNQDNIIEYQTVGHDLTDLKETQEKLAQAHSQLRQLAHQLIEERENDRAELARDLHDDVLSSLGAMVLTLDEDASTETIYKNYSFLIDRLRSTVNNLRPPMLSYGLMTGFRELIEDFESFTTKGPEITLDINCEDTRFDLDFEKHVFRIVQQACENAIIHSKACHINISGEISPNKITLCVKDDGCGFLYQDDTDINRFLTNKQYGVAGMMERATLIGGDVDINTRLGSGTQITLNWYGKQNET
jgi:PAS domain S-box-containing protein